MITQFIFLLILLNVGHWLGDFTQLSSPYMLAAKKFGTPLMPIFTHACIHSILVSIVLIYFNIPFTLILGSIFIMLISHFTIDVLKGKMNKWFPTLQDPSKYWHWWVFGLDQLLHQLVLILITYIAITSI